MTVVLLHSREFKVVTTLVSDDAFHHFLHSKEALVDGRGRNGGVGGEDSVNQRIQLVGLALVLAGLDSVEYPEVQNVQIRRLRRLATQLNVPPKCLASLLNLFVIFANVRGRVVLLNDNLVTLPAYLTKHSQLLIVPYFHVLI